jgi:hypothetical protein
MDPLRLSITYAKLYKSHQALREDHEQERGQRTEFGESLGLHLGKRGFSRRMAAFEMTME